MLKIIDIEYQNCRNKHKASSIYVGTQWAVGHYLTDKSREKLKSLVADIDNRAGKALPFHSRKHVTGETVEDRLDWLQCHAIELRDAIKRGDPPSPIVVHLAPAERVLLELLVKRPIVSLTKAFDHMYADRLDCDRPNIGNVYVYMSRLRRAFKDMGITIEHERDGWSLPPASKVKLAEIMGRSLDG